MALLQPDTARIGHPPGQPAEDRFPEQLVSGTPREVREALSKLVGANQVLYRAIDLVRYASDASPYRLIPQVVVAPRTVDDVVALLKYCRENKRHATFRAAGTSLCGQSQSDDILIDVRKHWYGMSIEDGGLALRARPGVILGHAGAYLHPHADQHVFTHHYADKNGYRHAHPHTHAPIEHARSMYRFGRNGTGVPSIPGRSFMKL